MSNLSEQENLLCFDDEELLFDYSIFQPRRSELLLLEDKALKNTNYSEEIEEGCDFEFDYDQDISRADKLDYEVAAASGLLTAILDILWVEDFSLAKAKEWGCDEVEKLVVEVAKKKAGFVPKGTDKEAILQKAITKLEERFPIPADILSPKFGDGKFHHFRDFVHHPTILGLFFSILSQFTECGFGTDVDGKFHIYKIPKDKLSENLIGDTFEKKLLYGTVNWAFHLISDLDGSSNNPGKGTGIPGPILALFKEMSALPLINNIQIDYKGKDLKISAVLQKVFDGTLFAEHDANDKIIKGTEKPLDFRTELGIAKGFIKSTIPVIANECIVRAFYFIRRLFNEIKTSNISTLSDLANLDPKNFLPYDNRALTRMLTISSGTFMVIVTAKDAVAAAIKSKGDKKKFAAYFFLNVNYVGIVRFTFACKNDAGYIADDVKAEYRKYVDEKRREAVENNKEIPGLKSLMLDEAQTRILYSLKWDKVQHDIYCTTNPDIAAKKQQWLDEWGQALLLECNGDKNFIIKNERFLYANIKEAVRTSDSNAWLYLVAMELDQFIPYYLFDINQQIDKKLKLKNTYMDTIFCNMQNVITEKELKAIRQSYVSSNADLTNKKVKTAIGAAATVAVTAASGGLALVFAPKIAVALVGGSFAGLSGAALTSASLAAVGFGSLAAGGFGMAGGTAIIAGGGTLLGVIGSGAMTLSAKAFLTSKDVVLNECAKLLTFCREVLLNKYCDRETVLEIQGTVENNLHKIEQFINQAEATEVAEDKDVKQYKKMLANSKTSLKYIKRCNELLLDALEDKKAVAFSEAVSTIRKDHPCSLIWGRFEYKDQYIFLVSDNKPGTITNIAPGPYWQYSLDKKTLELTLLRPHQLITPEVDKLLKSMHETIVLMDITQAEYELLP